MHSHNDDLIADLLARVMAMSEDFTQAQALQIEQQIRHDWGGKRVYITKVRPGPQEKETRDAEQAKVEHGTPPRDVVRKSGLSRSTIYRVLKRG